MGQGPLSKCRASPAEPEEFKTLEETYKNQQHHSKCNCAPSSSASPHSSSHRSYSQVKQDWGPYNRSATPLPKPRKSKFEDSIWKSRLGFSLQICSDLHLEFYQPGLELPGIANPSSPSLRPKHNHPQKHNSQNGTIPSPPTVGRALRRSSTLPESLEPLRPPTSDPSPTTSSSDSNHSIHSSAPSLTSLSSDHFETHSDTQFNHSDLDSDSCSDSDEENGTKSMINTADPAPALEVPALLNRKAAQGLFEQFLQPGRARNLALLGDIGNPEFECYNFFLRWCSKRYENVFVVPGNHEGYGRPWHQTLKLVHEACLAAGSNVHFCNQSTFDLGNVRILATPLWSRIDADLQKKCQRGCSDYMLITTEDEPSGELRNITPADTNSWHEADLAWLSKEIQTGPHIPTIILTHHAPSMACLEPDVHPTEPFAQLSCSELDRLFQDPIVCWAYGHTHFPLDCRAGTIRLVTNPAGYPRSQFPSPFGRPYRPDLVLEL